MTSPDPTPVESSKDSNWALQVISALVAVGAVLVAAFAGYSLGASSASSETAAVAEVPVSSQEESAPVQPPSTQEQSPQPVPAPTQPVDPAPAPAPDPYLPPGNDPDCRSDLQGGEAISIGPDGFVYVNPGYCFMCKCVEPGQDPQPLYTPPGASLLDGTDPSLDSLLETVPGEVDLNELLDQVTPLLEFYLSDQTLNQLLTTP